MQEPIVLLESYLGGHSYRFCDLQKEVVAYEPHEVKDALCIIDDAVAQGFHAAGFLSYEAASGLDAKLVTQEANGLPLIWFGIFARREIWHAKAENEGKYTLSDWQASVTRPMYDDMMRKVRNYIVAGDTYQVNYTFRLRAKFDGDARRFYRHLCQNQRTDYAAYLDMGKYQILSASPELFFQLKDGCLTTRPMKGTGARGRWLAEDEENRNRLQRSEKDRAENVMIVDLLRNDLGRVSQAGSVSVPVLWEVERYETVLQMTSTVTSQPNEGVSFSQLMTAMFPCGSVTGAPKLRTMEIVAEVEPDPRGIYTGSIGYVSPHGEACFNVAIRTVCINRETGLAEFGVGGGITFDSSTDGEYDECLTKARVLTSGRSDFDLFETLRHDPIGGYFLLDRHLSRLEASAIYFGFCFDRKRVVDCLRDKAKHFDKESHRVRCVLKRSGQVLVEAVPLSPAQAHAWRVGFAKTPVSSQDVMLFHKTTSRNVYTNRLAERPDCEEVILVNERGEVTECSIGNIVVKKKGAYMTPPVDCGLLAGTFRDELLAQGKIAEQILTEADIKQADALFMINSVREWVPLTWVE
jgi:para-aminobenzoate synthetase/4-amino-4-deoxychorismate lyase